MSKLLVSVVKVDFTPQDGERIVGSKLLYVEQVVDDDTGEQRYVTDKHWIPADDHYLTKKADELKPGQMFEFDFLIGARKKLILKDIIPGKAAVDFDKIFEKGD